MILRNISKIFLPALLIMGFAACDIETIEDPNNPSIGAITANASLSEIQNLVTGIEGGMRLNLGQYFDGVGVIGREFYRFSTSDPRFTSDLLGKGSAVLDNNTFYTTNPYSSRYRTVKNCNILLEAVGNSTAITSNTSRDAAKGFANTIKAHQLLLVWVSQYDNGLRIEVADPANPGPFVGVGNPGEALRAIAQLLDAGYAQLNAGGAAFPFSLTSGFAGFDTPSDFAKINRAIQARVHVYNQDWNNALAALTNSFFDINGSISTGAYYPFSTSGGDQLNPQWYPMNSSGETRVAHASYVADADAGDSRLSKVSARTSTEFQDGLQSDFDFNVYASNAASIPIIRNEELILIFAEAKIQIGDPIALADGAVALDIVRQKAGLGQYAGPITKADLIDEMLKQRRYSLYGEGHRWVDMRRYGRLNTLPIDRVGDDVWERFPRPANEE